MLPETAGQKMLEHRDCTGALPLRFLNEIYNLCRFTDGGIMLILILSSI